MLKPNNTKNIEMATPCHVSLYYKHVYPKVIRVLVYTKKNYTQKTGPINSLKYQSTILWSIAQKKPSPLYPKVVKPQKSFA